VRCDNAVAVDVLCKMHSLVDSNVQKITTDCVACNVTMQRLRRECSGMCGGFNAVERLYSSWDCETHICFINNNNNNDNDLTPLIMKYCCKDFT